MAIEFKVTLPGKNYTTIKELLKATFNAYGLQWNWIQKKWIGQKTIVIPNFIGKEVSGKFLLEKTELIIKTDEPEIIEPIRRYVSNYGFIEEVVEKERVVEVEVEKEKLQWTKNGHLEPDYNAIYNSAKRYGEEFAKKWVKMEREWFEEYDHREKKTGSVMKNESGN